MTDELFEEMLEEINAMTSEEYWKLYNEAKNIQDCIMNFNT